MIAFVVIGIPALAILFLYALFILEGRNDETWV